MRNYTEVSVVINSSTEERNKRHETMNNILRSAATIVVRIAWEGKYFGEKYLIRCWSRQSSMTETDWSPVKFGITWRLVAANEEENVLNLFLAMKNTKLVLDRGKEKYSYSVQGRSLAIIIKVFEDKSFHNLGEFIKSVTASFLLIPRYHSSWSVCLEAQSKAQGKIVDVLM